ncbi:MAG TPA: class F sortase [Candidatus Saccharimonadales bacterium]
MQVLLGKISKHQENISLVLAILLVAAGSVCATLFASSQQAPPTPPANQPHAVPSMQGDIDDRLVLPFSRPTYIRIPAIDVESNIIAIGKNEDGSIGMPSQSDYNKAAWYENSPAPGQFGSSIIEGHVDYADAGPAIFFKLGALKKGDTVRVTRADGRVAIFTVYKIQTYKKSLFPTKEVYGATRRPTLTLITCGGAFNPSIGDYDSNIVVFSALTAIN